MREPPDAVLVTDLPFTHSVDTSEATTADDDPFCVGQAPTVWYVYSAPADATIEANTFGSDYDTTLGAYTGTRGDLTEIACNDDADGGQSRVVIDVSAGETVYFMVAAWASGPGGNLIINVDFWSEPPPPPAFTVGLTLDRAGTFDPRTGVAYVRGTTTCSLWSYVDVFGVLRQRIGRVIAEAPFWSFAFCDGNGQWEAVAHAPNILLVGGPAEVWVTASFFDPTHGQHSFAFAEGTVHLRGGSGRPAASLDSETMASARGPFGSLAEVLRHDPRLKRSH